jgi:hypothetical protein
MFMFMSSLGDAWVLLRDPQRAIALTLGNDFIDDDDVVIP